MKKTVTILAAVLFTVSVFAQAPRNMSYQAVVRDGSNHLVINHAVGMQIRILQGSVSGTVVYTETQTPTTNANGLVSIEIGGDPGFESIDWSAGTYFIKTETDPTGGTNYTITGTSQLLSVPYALYAKKAETVKTITETDITNLSNLSGTNTGDQDLSSYATKNMGNANITNLATPINTQDAANKAYVDLLKAQIEELKFFTGKLVKDKDGNIYNTVTIGTQVWMAENLKTTKYNDGTSIPLVVNATAWAALTTPAYCWYNNDSATYAQTYGALYNWYTVEADKLCPIGWHVPSDAEWTSLQTYLGGTMVGNKLKETGTTHWNSPNTGATNETGFTALPGGYCFANGTFAVIGNQGYWWSATAAGLTSAWYRTMWYDSGALNGSSNNKQIGYSVRCVRD